MTRDEKYRGFGVQTAGNTKSRAFQRAINDENPSGGLGEPSHQRSLKIMKNQWILMDGYSFGVKVVDFM